MVTERPIHEAVIARIIELAPQTRSLWLRLPPSQSFTFLPGQFISCLLPVGSETILRPYSLASSPEQAPHMLEICLNLVPNGPGSGYLFGLRPGATIRFTGPWGTFTLDEPPPAECVFIADGTGIAPIRPMLRRAVARNGTHPLRLHHAAEGPEYLLYREEFEAFEREWTRFTYAPLVGASLAELVQRLYVMQDTDRARHFYICGVGAIVPQLRDLLRRAGYERRAVQYEKW
jgi:ferredoxin-NADP reductase